VQAEMLALIGERKGRFNSPFFMDKCHTVTLQLARY